MGNRLVKLDIQGGYVVSGGVWEVGTALFVAYDTNESVGRKNFEKVIIFMEIQRDIEWKLSKLKEALVKSDNVTNEVKGLIEKATTDSIGVEVSKLNVGQAFELYQTRYYFLELKGKYNENFKNLLTRLAKTNKTLGLIITILRIENNSYLVFTDKDYHECFGLI